MIYTPRLTKYQWNCVFHMFYLSKRELANENVCICLSNSLLSDGTKPFSETMMTNQQWGHMAFIWGKFAWDAQDVYPWYGFENYSFKITTASSRCQWVKSWSRVPNWWYVSIGLGSDSAPNRRQAIARWPNGDHILWYILIYLLPDLNEVYSELTMK